jgi:hypothetical protein
MIKQKVKGNSIRILALTLGVTFEELAVLCEVSHATVNAWSSRIFRIKREALETLCRKEDMDINEVIDFLNDGGFEVYE